MWNQLKQPKPKRHYSFKDENRENLEKHWVYFAKEDWDKLLQLAPLYVEEVLKLPIRASRAGPFMIRKVLKEVIERMEKELDEVFGDDGDKEEKRDEV